MSLFQITKKQHDYMLPVFGLAGMISSRLMTRSDRGFDKYYFVGTREDYEDFLNRCKYL